MTRPVDFTPGSGDGKKIDEKSKLEQDYIQMYLGELTPMQESELVQLKLRVSELLKGKALPSDPVFLRFLRARDFNVESKRNAQPIPHLEEETCC